MTPVLPSAPRLALAMPVYNGAAYLGEALDALQAQTEADWVAVVTDNASTDDTPEIVREHAEADPRIRYHRNETNLGANGNFNRSMALAVETGAPFVKWAAHDDCPHPAYLATCLAALEAHPEAVGAHSAIRLIDGDGEPYPYSARAGGFVASADDLWRWDPADLQVYERPDPSERLARFLRAKSGEWMTYGVFRSDAVAKTRPFAMPGVEDALCAELLLRGPVRFVRETLFDHRLHAASARHLSRDEYLEYETGERPVSPVLPSIGRAVDFARAIGRAPLSPAATVRSFAALVSFAAGLGRLRNLVVPGPHNYLGLDFSRRS
ncbi:MAG: glycosyltransferase [Bacteroidota bacterium]